MDQILQTLKHTLPCRNSQIEKLFNLFVHKDEPYLDTVFAYGGPCTGKSVVVGSVLEKLQIKHIIVNLEECYTPKILFETILNDLHGHKLDPGNLATARKCDTVMDFIIYLESECKHLGDFVIVLDKAEELRNMSSNILRMFLKLKEFCGLSVTVLFISEIIFENYLHQTVVPYKFFFPQYTINEVVKILMLEEEKNRILVTNHYRKHIDFSSEFYENYLNIFLSVFYRTTRHMSELRRMSRLNFLKYCEPIADGTHTIDDSLALWRNISPILKSSLEDLHIMLETEKIPTRKILSQDMVTILELPYYAKYLLIAAYLASYNSTKEDKRLFMKFQGSKQKSRTRTKVQRNIAKQLNVQLGPSPFTFDRLLAIFYSMLDQKVGFNNNLLVQVSSLVELKFLLVVSDSTAIESQKYKCNVTYNFIQEISKMLGVNIRKYLYDF